MAIITRGVSRCPLCNQALGAGDALVATSAFLRSTDPWWKLSDAAMHSRCYERWPDRVAFSRKYFETTRVVTNPFWGVALDDTDVRVTVNPYPDIDEASVSFALHITGARVPLASWSEWVSSTPDAAEPRVWREAFESAAPRLRGLGSATELVANAVFAPMDPEIERTAFCYRARAAAYQISQRGARCPTCAVERKDHRLVNELERGGRSYFVCAACDARFSHHDLLPARPWAR